MRASKGKSYLTTHSVALSSPLEHRLDPQGKPWGLRCPKMVPWKLLS